MNNLFLYKSRKSGFTVAELLVYIGIMTIALVAVVNLLVNSSKIMQGVQAEKEVRSSALIALERMNREIKGSDNIVVEGSAFGTNNGQLTLSKKDEDENNIQTSFRTNENGELEIFYNDTSAGSLITEEAVVEGLTFHQSLHGNTQSVRIKLELSAKKQPEKRVTFYSTAVLRGTY